jgi:hypothetical protein
MPYTLLGIEQVNGLVLRWTSDDAAEGEALAAD